MSKQETRQRTRQAQRRERREEERRREVARQNTRRRNTIIFTGIIAGVVAVVIFAIVYNVWLRNTSTNTNGDTPNNGAYPEIANVSCDQFEHSDHHIHAQMTIYMNGQPVAIPQNIGIAADQSCLYWLHTHDAAGIIHVEAPANQDYTVGSFLQVWRERFASQQYPNQLSAIDGWTAYVDGEPFEGDFNDIQLVSHRLITLAYNSPDITPVSEYNWPAELAQ